MGQLLPKSPPESPALCPDDLSTGDILLFHGNSTTDVAIETGSASPYCHVALVVRDPHFTTPRLRGLYVWESCLNEFDMNDAENGRHKMGVQMVEAGARLRKAWADGTTVFARKLLGARVASHSFQSRLAEAHSLVHNLPYDTSPVDWIRALARQLGVPISSAHVQREDRFWCSALVACVLAKLGLLAADVPWSRIAPGDLSSRASRIRLPWKSDRGHYGPDICVWRKRVPPR